MEEKKVNIASWLQALGLQQYEQAFRDNDIDDEVLPELTAEDIDAEVKALKLDERSVPITGKKGTLVFAETFGLHKASLLKEGERKILWNYFGD